VVGLAEVCCTELVHIQRATSSSTGTEVQKLFGAATSFIFAAVRYLSVLHGDSLQYGFSFSP